MAYEMLPVYIFFRFNMLLLFQKVYNITFPNCQKSLHSKNIYIFRLYSASIMLLIREGLKGTKRMFVFNNNKKGPNYLYVRSIYFQNTLSFLSFEVHLSWPYCDKILFSIFTPLWSALLCHVFSVYSSGPAPAITWKTRGESTCHLFVLRNAQYSANSKKSAL